MYPNDPLDIELNTPKRTLGQVLTRKPAMGVEAVDFDVGEAPKKPAMQRVVDKFKSAGGAAVPETPRTLGGRAKAFGGAVARKVPLIAGAMGAAGAVSDPATEEALGFGGAAAGGAVNALSLGIVPPETTASFLQNRAQDAAHIAGKMGLLGENAQKHGAPTYTSGDELRAKVANARTGLKGAATTQPAAPAPAREGEFIPAGQGNSNISADELRQILYEQKQQREADEFVANKKTQGFGAHVSDLVARASNGDLAALGQLAGMRSISKKKREDERVGLVREHENTLRRGQDMHMMGLQAQKALGWANHARELRKDNETRITGMVKEKHTDKDGKLLPSYNEEMKGLRTYLMKHNAKNGTSLDIADLDPASVHQLDYAAAVTKAGKPGLATNVFRYMGGRGWAPEDDDPTSGLPVAGSKTSGLRGSAFYDQNNQMRYYNDAADRPFLGIGSGGNVQHRMLLEQALKGR